MYIETATAGTSKNVASTAALTVPDRPSTYDPRLAPVTAGDDQIDVRDERLDAGDDAVGRGALDGVAEVVLVDGHLV